MNREAVLPFCVMESVEKSVFSLYGVVNRRTWEILRASSGKVDTDGIPVRFQPLSLHFFERVD